MTNNTQATVADLRNWFPHGACADTSNRRSHQEPLTQTNADSERTHPEDLANLPKAEFMMPGPERDRLVDLILDGTKTATTSLLIDYQECGDPLPKVGDQSMLVDSDECGVAVLVTTAVDVVRLADVTDRHAIDEGEGNTTADEWRRVHEAFWDSQNYRAEFTDHDFPIDDDTPVVLEHFTVKELLPQR
ncbi:ASCH domain-containing protein [Bifidobacterium callitrichos]|uniref:ASCH domain-containing protein n=1 Tax=Bifidobacterium callitrichos TaxID=762209 RepID=A0A5M9ZED8_9BIFI|nr:ASCH domain-containing protein [Bifidobacterium callitrichos]KAA8817497.1 ASCH domain-containing protein [Bifidobacterium callitrichos]